MHRHDLFQMFPHGLRFADIGQCAGFCAGRAVKWKCKTEARLFLRILLAFLKTILVVALAISVASYSDLQKDYMNGKLHKGIT